MADQTIMGYRLGEKLGFGAFSWAVKGYKGDQVVALKFTKKNEGSERAQKRQLSEITTELKVFETVKHPNIVRLYEFRENLEYTHSNGNVDTVFAMALELCEGGELFDIVYYTGKLDEKLSRTFFAQIVAGVKALHDNNLCHRDIKPQNILLTSDFVVKIADFGSSKEFTSHHLMRTNRVGTRGYQAPELLLQRGYTKKCDIFALGVLLFVCLTKHPPFKNAVAEDQWFRQIAKKAFNEFWNKHPRDQLSDHCKDLIVKCLCYQPLDRLDCAAILEHDFMKGEMYAQDEMSAVLSDRKTQATAARNNDTVRSPEKYDSMTHRAAGEGATLPPALPQHRRLYAFKTDSHPFVINHALQKNFELKNKWKAVVSDAKCNLQLQATLKITDPDDWLYDPESDNLVTVTAEVQGYVDGSEFPEDWDEETHTGTFYADVRITSEFCEPATVVYNQILNYLGFEDLDEEDESESSDDSAE